MKGDLISRSALREDLRRFFPTEVLEGIEPKTLFAQIMHDIDNAPTVSEITKEKLSNAYDQGYEDGKNNWLQEERPQGEWVIVKDKRWGDNVKCPFCGKELAGTDLNFCCKCGAKMKGGKE